MFLVWLCGFVCLFPRMQLCSLNNTPAQGTEIKQNKQQQKHYVVSSKMCVRIQTLSGLNMIPVIQNVEKMGNVTKTDTKRHF